MVCEMLEGALASVDAHVLVEVSFAQRYYVRQGAHQYAPGATVDDGTTSPDARAGWDRDLKSWQCMCAGHNIRFVSEGHTIPNPAGVDLLALDGCVHAFCARTPCRLIIDLRGCIAHQLVGEGDADANAIESDVLDRACKFFGVTSSNHGHGASTVFVVGSDTSASAYALTRKSKAANTLRSFWDGDLAALDSQMQGIDCWLTGKALVMRPQSEEVSSPAPAFSFDIARKHVNLVDNTTLDDVVADDILAALRASSPGEFNENMSLWKAWAKSGQRERARQFATQFVIDQTNLVDRARGVTGDAVRAAREVVQGWIDRASDFVDLLEFSVPNKYAILNDLFRVRSTGALGDPWMFVDSDGTELWQYALLRDATKPLILASREECESMLLRYTAPEMDQRIVHMDPVMDAAEVRAAIDEVVERVNAKLSELGVESPEGDALQPAHSLLPQKAANQLRAPVHVEDARFGAQLAPPIAASQPSVKPRDCPKNSVCQLKSYILYADFLGEDATGSNDFNMRPLLMDMLHRRLLENGVSLKNIHGVPDPELTQSLFGRINEVKTVDFVGHAMSWFYNEPTGMVYFVNSGMESDRHGVPPVRDGSPYNSVYAIIRKKMIDRFKSKDRQSIYNFEEMNKLTAQPASPYADGSIYYIVAVSALLNESNFTVANTKNGLAGLPYCSGIEFPTQTVGDCALRAIMLGMYAMYLDVVGESSLDNVDTLYRQWWEYQHELFLYELAEHVRDPDFAANVSDDEVLMLTLRMNHQMQHGASLGYDQSLPAAIIDLDTSLRSEMSEALKLNSPIQDVSDGPSLEQQLIHTQQNPPLARCGAYLKQYDEERYDASQLPMTPSLDSVKLTSEKMTLQDNYTSRELLDYLKHFARVPNKLTVRNLIAAQFPLMVYAWSRDVHEQTLPISRQLLVETDANIWDVYDMFTRMIGVPHMGRYAQEAQQKPRNDVRNARDADLVCVLLFLGMCHLHGVNEPSSSTNEYRPCDTQAGCGYDIVLHTDCWTEHEHVFEFVSTKLAACPWGARANAVQLMLRTVNTYMRAPCGHKNEPYAWATLVTWLRTSFSADSPLEVEWENGKPRIVEYEPESSCAIKPLASMANLTSAMWFLDAVDRCSPLMLTEGSTTPFLLSCGWGLGITDAGDHYDPNSIMPLYHTQNSHNNRKGYMEWNNTNDHFGHYGNRGYVKTTHHLPHTQVFAFRRLVEQRFNDQTGFEERIAALLQTLMNNMDHLPAENLVRTMASCLYYWDLMGYDDTSYMRELLFSPENLLDLTTLFTEIDDSRDSVVKKALKAGLQPWENDKLTRASSHYKTVHDHATNISEWNDRETALNARDVDKSTRMEMLTRFEMHLMPFMDQSAFNKYMDSMVTFLLDPENPYSAFAHILYGRHVRAKWVSYCSLRESNGFPISIEVMKYVGIDEKERALSIDTNGNVAVWLHTLIPHRGALKPPAIEVMCTLRNKKMVCNAPIFACMARFEWQESMAGSNAAHKWVGSPIDHSGDQSRRVQYRVAVDGMGVCYRMNAGLDRLVDINALADTSAAARRLVNRMSHFANLGDVLAWDVVGRGGRSGEVEIDIIDYGVAFIVRDGVLVFRDSSEYEVCTFGCKWSGSMDNVFLVREPVTGGRFFVVVFESVLEERLPRPAFRVASAFTQQCKFSTYETGEKRCHRIPIHASGLTIMPASYNAAWAYINSCILYRNCGLALEVRPILHAFEGVSRTTRKLSLPNTNWPLLMEACAPVFHPMCNGTTYTQVFANPFMLKSESILDARWVKVYAPGERGDLLREQDNNYDRKNKFALTKHFWDAILSLSLGSNSQTFGKTDTKVLGPAMVDTLRDMVAKPDTPRHTHRSREDFGMRTIQDVMRSNVEVVDSDDPERGGFDRDILPNDVDRPTALYPRTLLPLCVAYCARVDQNETCLALLWSFATKTPGVSHESPTVRLANLMYYFIKGYRPRADQFEAFEKVMRDLRGETAQVHAMMMGSGKTAVVTPMSVLESYYRDVEIENQTAKCTVVVLPQGLLQQSASMLARELQPYSLVPVGVHSSSAAAPRERIVSLMSESVAKQLVMAQDAIKQDPPVHYIFDEVDTLCNPLISELNMPTTCPAEWSANCQPVMDLSLLFEAIIEAVGEGRGKLQLFDSVDRSIATPIEQEYQAMYGMAQTQRHRQHFGIASHEDYQVHGSPSSYVAIPFSYADTPAIGSKYSNVIYSMIVTAISYADTPALPVDSIRALFDKAISQVVTPKGCGEKAIVSDLHRSCVQVTGRPDFDRMLNEEIRGVSADKMLRDLFIRECVAVEFQVRPARFNVTGIEMLMSCNAPRRSAFTGTPEALGSEQFDDKPITFAPSEIPGIPHGLQPNVFVYDDAKFLDALERIQAFSLAELGDRVRVLIDGGCELLYDTVADVYSRMRNVVDAPLLYWDKRTTVPTLHSSGGIAEWSGVDDGLISVCYRHANTTGIDAVLRPGTIGALTVGEKMRYRDFAQALYRLRKIEVENGHRCIVAIRRSVFNQIKTDQGMDMSAETLDREQLVAWLHANDRRYNQLQVSMIRSQCLRGIVRGNAGVRAQEKRNAFRCYVPNVLIGSIAARTKDWYRSLVKTCDFSTSCSSHFSPQTVEESIEEILKGMGMNVFAQEQEQAQDQEQEQEQEQEMEQEQEQEQQRSFEGIPRPGLGGDAFTFDTFGESDPTTSRPDWVLRAQRHSTSGQHLFMAPPAIGYFIAAVGGYSRERYSVAVRYLYLVFWKPLKASGPERRRHHVMLPGWAAAHVAHCMMTLPDPMERTPEARRRALEVPMMMMEYGANWGAKSMSDVKITCSRKWDPTPEDDRYIVDVIQDCYNYGKV